MTSRFWNEACAYGMAVVLVLTVLSWCGCSEPPLKRPPKRASACQCAEAPR